jgi:hypothetical protein
MNFRSKNRELTERAIGILRAEQPMTLRQLFYRLVSAGALHNRPAEYKRLGSVMTRLREAREVPLCWIVDHVRSTLKPSSWSGLADFGEAVRDAYRMDFWARLGDHVEVFVEKDAVAGTIQPVTQEYDIRLRVCRGYASVSFAGDIAGLWKQVRKPIHAYYLGDFDPSGFDIERDLCAKLARYSGCDYVDDQPDADSFRWTRLALRAEDFKRHQLIRLPVKQSDKRAAAFMRQHGPYGAELDALEPTELRRRVEAAIRGHIDQARWEQLQLVERKERESVQAMIANWKGAA